MNILTLIEPYLIARKEFKKGDIVCKPNVLSNELYYIQKGACKQYYINQEGQEIVFRLIEANDFCASAYSLITKKESFDEIQCVKESAILVYDYRKLELAYETNIELAIMARKITEKYFIDEQQRSIVLANLVPRERYKYFLEKYPNAIETFNLGVIASFLGMKQETLSRVRAERF